MIYDIMKIWRKRLTHSLTELINEEAVYRTAPATPGLIIIFSNIFCVGLTIVEIPTLDKDKTNPGYCIKWELNSQSQFFPS